MGTTLGIYEPFKPYVKKQLEVRKNLMENSDSLRNEEFYAYTVKNVVLSQWLLELIYEKVLRMIF